MSSLPAISGRDLIKLLRKDGWEIQRSARHGVALTKRFPDKKRVTVVPTRSTPLAPGTLSAILGAKQTGMGRNGLEKLIKESG